MRHRRVIIGAALLLLCVIAAVYAAGALAPGGTSAARAADPVVLTVQHNGTLIKQYTLAELQALTVYNGYAGIHNSAGTITGPDPVTGVRASDVLTDALGGAGVTATQKVDFIAADSYAQTVWGDQVNTPTVTNWVMFNSETGQQITTSSDVQGQLSCILAWARSGSALPADEGPLRLYVADSLSGEKVVMRGSDSEFRVVKLNVRDVDETLVVPWKVTLVGLKSHGTRPTNVIDMQSYQSCAAPGCHGVAWKAPDGVRWTGVALYMLIGQVDGGKDMTYNARLARKGYRIRLYSAAGKSVTLSSKITVRRSSIVVANSAGGDLVPAYYPLRLVGPAKFVPAGKRLGSITKIVMLPLK
jgi:hypothetical protein